MSEAIGTAQLAMGQTQPDRRPSPKYCNADGDAQVLPVAYCLLPNAGFQVANPCTVTPHGTSVTNLRLAESVLISVGKLALELEPGKHVWPAFRLVPRVPRCSFRGGTCIQ
jgi:hypothetical protein